jgi:hypothetical protein
VAASAALRCGAERARSPRALPAVAASSQAAGCPTSPQKDCSAVVAAVAVAVAVVSRVADVDPIHPNRHLHHPRTAHRSARSTPTLRTPPRPPPPLRGGSRESVVGTYLASACQPSICSASADYRNNQYYYKNVNLKKVRWFLPPPRPLPPSP